MSSPAEIIHSMTTRSMGKMRMAAVFPGGILSWLTASKQLMMEDGGPEITNPTAFGANSNVGVARYYDRVPVNRSSELDTVSYEFTRIVGTYVISEQEIDENQGQAKIVDIAKAKLEALELAIKLYRRTKAVGTNTGYEPNGLGNLIPAVPTAGSVGGINLATQPLWRTSVYDYSSSPLTSATIEEAFDDILLDMNTEDGKISVIAAGRNVYKLLTAAARDKGTMQLSQQGFNAKIADLGLVGVSIQGIAVIYDEEMDLDQAYLLNGSEIYTHILKSANMKMKDLTAPYDQDVLGKRMILETQMCSWKQYRTHALVING